jgi:hypothetical protein
LAPAAGLSSPPTLTEGESWSVPCLFPLRQLLIVEVDVVHIEVAEKTLSGV